MRGIVWMGEQAEIRNDVEVRRAGPGEVWYASSPPVCATAT